MSNYPVNPLSMVAAMPMNLQKKSGEGSSWFEAMAEAWGNTLNAQAERIQQQSDIIANGADTPAEVTKLTTESLVMGFLSNNAHTSITKVGEAVETVARKQ